MDVEPYYCDDCERYVDAEHAWLAGIDPLPEHKERFAELDQLYPSVKPRPVINWFEDKDK